jgi:hypothetical protein
VNKIGNFPFGEPVKIVAQKDRTPKRVFLLGVYASAVHAKWLDPNGNQVVRALAVASEPYIFWRGEDADKIIENNVFPNELGKLIPAECRFNGPSGRILDEKILKPLGLTRADAWICDLVPYSCMNKNQQNALEKNYTPRIKSFGLPLPTVPKVKSFSEMKNDNKRRKEIFDELMESKADILILLGDQPIKCFLSHYTKRWNCLSDFNKYGELIKAEIGLRELYILPLAHPRQIGRIGKSSVHWEIKHNHWIDNKAEEILDN